MSDARPHLQAVADGTDAATPRARGRRVDGVTPPQPPRRLGALPDRRARSSSASSTRARRRRRSRRLAAPGVPPERVLLDQHAITAEQLSRAIAERYGLDHLDLGVFKVDMAAANLLSASAARRYGAVPVALHRRADAAAGDGRPGERARGRRHRAADADGRQAGGRLGGGHRGADHAHEPLRGRGPGGGRGERGRGRRRSRSSTCASRPTTRRSSSSCTRSSPRRPSAAHRTSTSSRSPTTTGAAAARCGCGCAIDGVLTDAATRAEADGRGRRLADQDHERPRHLRASRAAGRSRRADGRGPPRRRPRRDASERRTASRSCCGSSTRRASASSSRGSACSSTSSTDSAGRSRAPTARCSRPGRQARASRPRCTAR